MSRMKNIMQKCESMRKKVDQRYDVTVSDVKTVCENSNGRYDLFSNAFAIGYMQGMKAAKLEMLKGGVV